MQNITTQVNIFEKKIEKLEAHRECIVSRITDSVGNPRVNHLYLVAIEDDLRSARRSLTRLRKKNDAA